MGSSWSGPTSHIEAENDWYRTRSPLTQPLPRITADMTAPPPVGGGEVGSAAGRAREVRFA